MLAWEHLLQSPAKDAVFAWPICCPSLCVENERYDYACRMGMLVVAILHWVALGLMIWNDRVRADTSQDLDVAGVLAVIIRALSTVS